VSFDIIAYYTVMKAFLRINQYDNVLDIFEGLVDEGFEPDAMIFDLVLKTYLKLKDFESAARVLESLEDLSVDEPISGDNYTRASVAGRERRDDAIRQSVEGHTPFRDDHIEADPTGFLGDTKRRITDNQNEHLKAIGESKDESISIPPPNPREELREPAEKRIERMDTYRKKGWKQENIKGLESTDVADLEQDVLKMESEKFMFIPASTFEHFIEASVKVGRKESAIAIITEMIVRGLTPTRKCFQAIIGALVKEWDTRAYDFYIAMLEYGFMPDPRDNLTDRVFYMLEKNLDELGLIRFLQVLLGMFSLVSNQIEANIHVEERHFLLVGKFVNTFQTRIALSGVNQFNTRNNDENYPGAIIDRNYKPFELTSISYLSQRITSHRRMRLSSIMAKEFFPTGNNTPAYAMDPLPHRLMRFWCCLASNQFLRGHIQATDTSDVIEACGSLNLEYGQEVWRVLSGDGLKDNVDGRPHSWEKILNFSNIDTRSGVSWLGFVWKNGKIDEQKNDLEAHRAPDMIVYPQLRPLLSHFRSYVRVLVSWKSWDNIIPVMTEELFKEYVVPLAEQGLRRKFQHVEFINDVCAMLQGLDANSTSDDIIVYWEKKKQAGRNSGLKQGVYKNLGDGKTSDAVLSEQFAIDASGTSMIDREVREREEKDALENPGFEPSSVVKANEGSLNFRSRMPLHRARDETKMDILDEEKKNPSNPGGRIIDVAKMVDLGVLLGSRGNSIVEAKKGNQSETKNALKWRPLINGGNSIGGTKSYELGKRGDEKKTSGNVEKSIKDGSGVTLKLKSLSDYENLIGEARKEGSDENNSRERTLMRKLLSDDKGQVKKRYLRDATGKKNKRERREAALKAAGNGTKA
jgi:pentatricopeptide repeat protein